MTSPTSVDLPKPLDWQHLERLTRALFSDMRRGTFNRFGRSGQRQYGLDIIGHLSDGSNVGIQCKGRSSSLGKRLTQIEIDTAIAEADNFSGRLDEFHIVTTADDDAHLQKYAVTLNEARKTSNQFPVFIWGWQSLADEIRSSPKTMRTFYGEWWRKPSFLFLASLMLLAAALVMAALVGSRRIEQHLAMDDANRQNTVDGVQAVGMTLDRLHQAYNACISSMEGKDNVFAFSRQLRANCEKPIESPLAKLHQQRDQLAGVMNTDAFNEVVLADKYIDSEYRQLLVTIDMVKFFEAAAVRRAEFKCPKAEYKMSDDPGASDVFRKSGTDALSAQMARYFEIRDFVLPSITALKARLAVMSRVQKGQNIPDELATQANSLSMLNKQEREYTYRAPVSPFAMARVKEMSARDVKVSGVSPDQVDEALWRLVSTQALIEGLRGQKGDVEYLIRCGVLNEKARALETTDDVGAAP